MSENISHQIVNLNEAINLLRMSFKVFFFQNEPTFPLVRKDYYKKTVHGAYIQIGKSPSEQVQENEISYLG